MTMFRELFKKLFRNVPGRFRTKSRNFAERTSDMNSTRKIMKNEYTYDYVLTTFEKCRIMESQLLNYGKSIFRAIRTYGRACAHLPYKHMHMYMCFCAYAHKNVHMHMRMRMYKVF